MSARRRVLLCAFLLIDMKHRFKHLAVANAYKYDPIAKSTTQAPTNASYEISMNCAAIASVKPTGVLELNGNLKTMSNISIRSKHHPI